MHGIRFVATIPAYNYVVASRTQIMKLSTKNLYLIIT
jgi:hypothetical protein